MGLEPPTSGSGVQGVNHQATAPPTELLNNRRTGQIQYSPTLSKWGYLSTIPLLPKFYDSIPIFCGCTSRFVSMCRSKKNSGCGGSSFRPGWVQQILPFKNPMPWKFKGEGVRTPFWILVWCLKPPKAGFLMR